MNAPEMLLRATRYLKWFRDGAITVDTRPPDDISREGPAAEWRAALHPDLEPRTRFVDARARLVIRPMNLVLR